MLVLICGYHNSGKDTVADYLVSEYKFEKVSLSDPIKSIGSIISTHSLDVLTGDTPVNRSTREIVRDDIWDLTGRELLDKIGLLFATYWDPNIWCKLACLKIKELLRNGKHVVVSDVYYDYQQDFLKLKFCPITWRIFRFEKSELRKTEKASQLIIHDQLVYNTGTIEDLYDQIDGLLK